jgi:hypothetical protein
VRPGDNWNQPHRFEARRSRRDHDPSVGNIFSPGFLQAGTVAAIGAEVGAGYAMASGVAQTGGRSNLQTSVKALVFDTFGTVVDWRTSVTQEVESLATRKGLTLDGAKFADAWRAGYAPSMNRVRTGELPVDQA